MCDEKAGQVFLGSLLRKIILHKAADDFIPVLVCLALLSQ